MGNMKKPFFTIVIPTKDRPEYLKDCLISVINQSFQDFEIIVSDNGTNKLCDNIIKQIADCRVKYKRPERELGSCDNFEFAQKSFEGDYLIVLGDKNRLYGNALKKIYDIVINKKADIVTFGMNIFTLLDAGKNLSERRNLREGYFNNNIKYTKEVKKISGIDIIKEKLDFQNPFGFEKGLLYGNSAYSKNLVKKIVKFNGNNRLFDGVIPDRYTSFIAVGLSNNIQYIDEPLSLYMANGLHASDMVKEKNGLTTFESNWMHANEKYSKKYLENYPPIKGCFGLVKNVQAGDYQLAMTRLKQSVLVDEDVRQELFTLQIDNVNFIYEVLDEMKAVNSLDNQKQRYDNQIDKYIKMLNEQQTALLNEKIFKRNKNDEIIKIKRIGYMLVSKMVLKYGKRNKHKLYDICNYIDRGHIFTSDLLEYIKDR
jgi:glycosyltransferase involved in cell wall biosynthesis